MSSLSNMTEIYQELFLPPTKIRIHRYNREETVKAIHQIVALGGCERLGLAIARTKAGRVKTMVVATPEEAVIIDGGEYTSSSPIPKDVALKKFSWKYVKLAGFSMARMVLYLGRDFRLHIQAVDIGVECSPSRLNPLSPKELVQNKLCLTISDPDKFQSVWDENLDEPNEQNVVLRAWLSARLAKACSTEVDNAAKTNPGALPLWALRCLTDLVQQADTLKHNESAVTKAEFSELKSVRGDIELVNMRYKTRVRKSEAKILISDENGKTRVGRALRINGKTTTITCNEKITRGRHTVTVVGRQDRTNVERAQDEFTLSVLQGKRSMAKSIFIDILWLKRPVLKRDSTAEEFDSGNLNPSQTKVVSGMLGNVPIVLVHGPPGTGKTTAIGKAAQVWDRRGSPAWIVAHSNVAVKNIALNLTKCGVDFRIIISKEFYVEWHEHLYKKLEKRLIRSDNLPNYTTDLERMLGGSKIILSTLSMLSNPGLEDVGMFRSVPVERLVIDEASQINIFEYLACLKYRFIHHSRSNIHPAYLWDVYKTAKMPPFGQEKTSTIKSIFDIPHFKRASYFLDTQYRIPTFIGDFISSQVYQNKLRSVHSITTPNALVFVNANGVEKRAGTSYVNAKEVQTIQHLVRSYYKTSEFAIITPYDAQRAAIEKDLRNANLPWEAKVFNVDSFQGNEANYILISVVRTNAPGFLKALNRMNVMLTRCKKGMVIVTHQNFIQTGARKTLLGKLAKHLEATVGKDRAWIDWRKVVESKAALPFESLPKKEKDEKEEEEEDE